MSLWRSQHPWLLPHGRRVEELSLVLPEDLQDPNQRLHLYAWLFALPSSCHVQGAVIGAGLLQPLHGLLNLGFHMLVHVQMVPGATMLFGKLDGLLGTPSGLPMGHYKSGVGINNVGLGPGEIFGGGMLNHPLVDW